MNINPNTRKTLGIAAIILTAGCMVFAFIINAIFDSKEQRELFDQGALQGASVVLQSNQQGVTNMDVRVFLDAAWWLHTNKGGVK